MLMVLIPALCIFHFGQPKTDCSALLPFMDAQLLLVAWCMQGSMLQSNVNDPFIHMLTLTMAILLIRCLRICCIGS